MPRNPPPSHTRDPEDDKPERGGERIVSARRLRHDADDVDDDEEDAYDDDLGDDDDDGDDDGDDEEAYYEARTVEVASAAQDEGAGRQSVADPRPRSSSRDDEADDEDDPYDDEQALTEADVMEVLDLDDLKKMEGPDA
jgi:hypothetical protein